MRELIAKGVCGLTLALVIGLSFLFAARHNRVARVEAAPEPVITKPPPPPVEPAPVPPDIARGRMIFEEQNCGTCHSIEGAGNPRYPLDGVGSRLGKDELRMWITGTGEAADVLPGSIVKRKQRYREMPTADLNALLEFLLSVKPATKPAVK
jgi:mono/diheme cytochrome c family protein